MFPAHFFHQLEYTGARAQAALTCHHDFMNPVPLDTLQWTNPPLSETMTDGVLTVETGDQTDFWRETFYGFVHDNGHFGFTEVSGDFSAEVSFAGDYTELYDQAGMMIRLDAQTWLKAGIEYTDGQQHLSVVVTRGVSDWSVLPLTAPPSEIKLRLTRLGNAVLIQVSLDGGDTYTMLRLAALTDAAQLQVGVMCASPKRSGFQATFRDLRIGEPVVTELHT